MAYNWRSSWWPVVSDYRAADLVQDAELYYYVTVGPDTPPPSPPPPPDWTPPPSTTPPGDIVPAPLPPPTVPHLGIGPVYGYQSNAVVGGELITAATSSIFGGDVSDGGPGVPDFVMCPLAPTVPENHEMTPCEVMTVYSDGTTLSVADTAAIWGAVGPNGITSSLGPVYYTVYAEAAIGGGDEGSFGCPDPATWDITEPICGPDDFATSGTLDVGGGTGVWYDLPDDEANIGSPNLTPTLHQTRHGRKAHSPLFGDYGAQLSAVEFGGYMVNPTPHPEVDYHRDAGGYLLRPSVTGYSPHPSAYELPVECYFTWEELPLIPDLTAGAVVRSHHFPFGYLRCSVVAWRPDPTQPDFPPEPPPVTPSTVVASLGPEGAVLPRRPAPGG